MAENRHSAIQAINVLQHVKSRGRKRLAPRGPTTKGRTHCESHFTVIAVTESSGEILLKTTSMKVARQPCQTLLASSSLADALNAIGKSDRFFRGSLLFRAGDPNASVFLVYDGTVRLRVPEMPSLDRLFSTGSLLGLPSTFNAKPYSLTAACLTDCVVAQVTAGDFLHLMKARPDLCRDATDLLSAELAFILSAVRKRARNTAAWSHRRCCLR